MMVRTKVLLFAAASVGLVVLMGGGLVAGANEGRRIREVARAAEAQELLLAGLHTDSALYVPALLEALEGQRSTEAVFDEALRRSREAFEQLRVLVHMEERHGGGEDEDTALVQAQEAHRRWLAKTETRARQLTPGTGSELILESRRAFTRDVEPLLQNSWRFEAAEKAILLKESDRAFEVGQALGKGLPVVSLLLVGGLALSILMPLRRYLRDFLAGAERVGKGDFEQLLPEDRKDEYGVVARTFNRMARELRDTMVEKQRLARAEAEASEREMRRYNAALEETVRERTAELEQTNARLLDSLQQLQATQAQLLFADRLASVGQLAAGVAHEINNPLAFIISNVEFAREELRRMAVADERQRTEAVAALYEAGEGAERVRIIVRELQNLARPDSLESGPVDLAAVVRSALKMATHLIRPRAQLVLEVDGVPPVHGNGARLCQVVLNLLLNAAHAIEPGHVERHTIRVSARAGNPGTVLVEVSDTGCGIPSEHLGRIFDPFFTTRPVGTGTGLGLAVCHGIVASHGGDITVDSQPGRGSTFRVSLPVSGLPPYLDPVSGGSRARAPAPRPQVSAAAGTVDVPAPGVPYHRDLKAGN